MNIIVWGSLAFDRVMEFPGRFQDHILPDQIHQISLSLFIERLEQRRGGAAGNIVHNLALLGEKPVVVGTVGKDGAEYIEAMRQREIDTSAVVIYDDLPTACWYAINDKHNNQIGGFHAGADVRPSTLKLDAYDPDSTFFFASVRNAKKELLQYEQECKQRGIPFFFDPGQTTPTYSGAELERMIQGSRMLIVNDYEFQMILNKTGLSHEEVRAMTKLLVITLGEHGSRVQTATEDITVPACKDIVVKEPTGAGDAYRAAFLKGMVLGASLQQCAQMGSTSAAFAIEQHGGQEHTFTIDEFKKRYEHSYAEECPLKIIEEVTTQ